MANPLFYPNTPEGKLDHMIEECAEVILAAQKVRRFGPTTGYMDNQQRLIEEMQDCIGAIQRYMVSLVESPSQ